MVIRVAVGGVAAISVLHPRVVNLEPPLAVPAAEPARLLPYGLGVDAAPLHLLRRVQRLKVGIGGVLPGVAVPLARRRPRDIPRGLLRLAARPAARPLLHDLADGVVKPVSASPEGVYAGVGVGEDLLLDIGQRVVNFFVRRVRRQPDNAAHFLYVDVENSGELLLAVLLNDALLGHIIHAGQIVCRVVIKLMVGDLRRADAHIVDLDDDVPILAPNSADAASCAVRPLDLEAAYDVCNLAAGAVVYLLGDALKLVVPKLLGIDRRGCRVRAAGDAEVGGAYFFGP